jgi:hypothetical protein
MSGIRPLSSFRITAAATLVCVAAGLAPSPSLAGPTAYDIGMFLDQPHPFADAPTALPEVGAPLYESQIRIPARFPQPSPEGADIPRPAFEPSLMDRMGQTAAAPPETPRSDDPALLTLGVGYYDFNDNAEAAEFRLEWRGKPLWWKLRPLAGVMGTSDAAVYGYGGIAFDFYLGRRLLIAPSFAAGLYSEGDGKDLGAVIEFRSGLEIGWRFDSGARISAIVYHLSNAGIDDINPGTEVFSIGYSLPLY